MVGSADALGQVWEGRWVGGRALRGRGRGRGVRGRSVAHLVDRVEMVLHALDGVVLAILHILGFEHL